MPHWSLLKWIRVSIGGSHPPYTKKPFLNIPPQIACGDITWKLSKHNLVISVGWCPYKRPRLDTQYGVKYVMHNARNVLSTKYFQETGRN